MCLASVFREPSPSSFCSTGQFILSNYQTTISFIIIHSVIITITNSIITVIPIFNIICLKLILTFPSVALVAALLAGGALLAHVDPYGEVCQLREAIP